MKRIVGNPIQLDSENDEQTVVLEAGSNKTLVINSPTLIDPTISGLELDSLKTQSIYWEELGDVLGLSQLSNLELQTQLDTSYFRAQGTSVSISLTGTNIFAAAGAPYYIYSGSYGGVGVYKSVSGATFSLNASLLYTTYTSDATAGQYCDINEDGTFMVVSDGANVVSLQTICVYKKVAGTFVPDYTLVDYSGLSCRISGSYILTGETDGKLHILYFDGTEWTEQQTLVVAGGSFINKMDIVGTNKLYYYDQVSTIKVYERVLTTWSLTASITSTSILGLNANGTLMVTHDVSNVYIYESNVLVKTIAQAGIVASCCSGIFVFYSTSTTISVSQKVGSDWIRSTNSVTSSGIASLACNDTRLVVGRPTINTHGRVNIYTISEYFNVELTTNIIKLKNTDFSLDITSNYSSIDLTASTTYINGAANLTGVLTVAGTTALTGAVTAASTVGITGALTVTSNTINLGTKVDLSSTKIDTTIPIVYRQDALHRAIDVYSFDDASVTTFHRFYSSTGILRGSIFSSGTGVSFYSVSDRKFKKDIAELDSSVDAIKRIQPRKFIWKSTLSESVGFVADELEFIPDAVIEIDGTKMIDKTACIPYLIKTVQELISRVEDLEKKSKDK